MDKECGVYQIQEINLAAGYGAEKILQRIAESSLREKLLLRSNKFLEQGWYKENLVNFLEFFSPKDGLAETVKSLENLFVQDFGLGEGQEGIEAVQEEQNPQGELLEDGQKGQEAQIGEKSQEGQEAQVEAGEAQLGEEAQVGEGFQEKQEAQEREYQKGQEAQIEDEAKKGQETRVGEVQEGQEAPKEPNGVWGEKEEEQEDYRVILYKKQQEGWEEKRINPRIYLKIINPPYLVPFELELIPFEGDTIPLKENILESDLFEETFSYCMFSSEEYLSRSFYKILDELELIQHMSWYKECYDLLVSEVLEGKKASRSFGRLYLDNAIPALSGRLEIIDSFQDYPYMQKRWENLGKRAEGEYPEWSQVIGLLVKFFTPICDVVSRGEIFIGDWLPQFGRYLD